MLRTADERDSVPLTIGRTRRGILAGFLGNGLALVALQEMAAKRKKKKKKKQKKSKKKKSPTQNTMCGAGCPTRMSCVSGACALRVCAACSYTTLQAAVDAAIPGDSIVMDAGTYTEPTYIDKSLSITGSERPYPSPVVGPGTIIKGTRQTAIYIAGGIAVNLSNLQITECYVGSNGGAITISGGAVVEITNSWLHENRADINGGGIYNTGTLRLVSSKISSCRAKQVGGGIFNSSSGRLYLIHSEITGNSAGGASGFSEAGGGIFNRETNAGRGVVTNEGSTVSQNSPDQCAYTTAC